MENQKIVCIDWKEFITFVIKSWKKVLLLFVVGCIFGVSLCFMTGKNIETKNEVAENSKNVTQARKLLSKSRIEEVNSSFTSYKSLVDQRNKLEKFMKNSIFLNLDESTAKSNTIVYSISENKKINALIDGYLSLIKNNDLFSAINKENKFSKIDPAYLNELISINLPEQNQGSTYLMNSSNQTSRAFTVTIYGKDDLQCKLITRCVRSQIINITKRLRKSFGSFSISDSGNTFGPVTSTQIVQSRSDYDDKITSVNNAIITINNSLSDDQKTYLNALIDSQINNKNEKTKVISVVNKKAVVLYAFLGGLIILLIYIIVMAIEYLFDHKVHSIDEFLRNTNINIITSLNHKKVLDLNVATEELKYISQKNNPKEIGLLSTLKDLKEENKIYDDLEKDGIDYKMIPATPETEEDFNTLLTLKKAIIFEKIGESKYDDLEKMLRYYKLKGIDIIGAVLIK